MRICASDIDRTIMVKAHWIEAIIEGNFSCPKCGRLLVVIPTIVTSISFCLGCNKYFIPVRKEEKHGEHATCGR